MKTQIVALLATTLFALGDGFPLWKTDPAKSTPFTVDVGRPFHFELGRGSGSDGLNTVAFGVDGIVTMYRQQPAGKWQTASIILSPEAIARIFDEVKTQEVMKMSAGYHANVHDGTQWVLWIKQDEKSKAIYFNNHFPKEIKRLAECLDKELASADLAKAAWKEVPIEKSREHDKALWGSME